MTIVMTAFVRERLAQLCSNHNQALSNSVEILRSTMQGFVSAPLNVPSLDILIGLSLQLIVRLSVTAYRIGLSICKSLCAESSRRLFVMEAGKHPARCSGRPPEAL